MDAATVEVVVKSRQQVTYRFKAPQRDGIYENVKLKVVNYSVGYGVANLSILETTEEKQLKRSRALIQQLPNVSQVLETGQPVEFNTAELLEKAGPPRPGLEYLLVLAAPTIDENLVEIGIQPSWARDSVFERYAESDLPSKLDFAKLTPEQQQREP